MAGFPARGCVCRDVFVCVSGEWRDGHALFGEMCIVKVVSLISSCRLFVLQATKAGVEAWERG